MHVDVQTQVHMQTLERNSSRKALDSTGARVVSWQNWSGKGYSQNK